MSDDKSKTNGTDPSQRLPSFKPPRDLSLGGVKPKKVFTPNLNVSRNKNKGPTSSSSNDTKKEDRNRRRDRNNSQRPNNRNGPNVIKSTGVFSEGLGSTERHSTRAAFSRDSRGAGDATPQVLQRPTIRVKDFVKIDKELEEQKIKRALGDASGLDEEESYDFKQARERDAPIKLPMDDGGYLRQKTLAVKQEIIVKEEPDDGVITSVVVPGVKQDSCDVPDIVTLLKSEEPKIMLLQFPQSLPGQAGGRDDEPRKKASAPSPSPSSQEVPDDQEKPVDNSCSLHDLEEGRIGKLRVYHSGRVTLALGDTEFEISLGTQAAFHQEVVSVASDEQSRSANIISLGALTHKLNVVPHWEDMFKKLNV